MDQTFQHNFCESRLQNNQGPELWNAYTSLVISVFPFILGFPKSSMFYNIACMLAINGFASFHYHYHLDWYGKQSDEITMIMSNYFGIWGLLRMYYFYNKKPINWYNGWNSTFMVLFLVINTFFLLYGTTFSFTTSVSLIFNQYYSLNCLINFISIFNRFFYFII